jgi:acetyltransferase EpsM
MNWPLAGAFDDGKPAGSWHLTTLIGRLDKLPQFCANHAQVHYITALGSNSVRRKIVQRIEAMSMPNLKPQTLRHTSAWTGSEVEVGDGTLFAPNTVATTRVKIGAHCILNVKASLSHDCIIENYCNINPNATIGGDVRLGEGCYLGAGAVVIEKRTIGAWSVIGAGSVVTQDLPDGVTAVGVPARIIKRRQDEPLDWRP